MGHWRLCQVHINLPGGPDTTGNILEIHTKLVERHEVDRSKGLTSDQVIVLTGAKAKECSIHLRRVGYRDPDTGKHYVFLTNIHHPAAKTICDIYHDRRQIELFFQRIKQDLKIKTFLQKCANGSAVMYRFHQVIAERQESRYIIRINTSITCSTSTQDKCTAHLVHKYIIDIIYLPGVFCLYAKVEDVYTNVVPELTCLNSAIARVLNREERGGIWHENGKIELDRSHVE